MRKTTCFDNVSDAVWKQDWVVHCHPVGNGLPALKYLAPYIFRVAINNKHILKLVHYNVIFRYKTTKSGQTKTCTLTAKEFIRRSLQHVLPKGFVEVRYYGFLGLGRRRQLAALRKQFVADHMETFIPNEEPEA